MTALATKPSLTIVRRLKATPAKVYAAWTDPAVMAKWFGPDECINQSTETDVRVGGRFRIVMVVKESGEIHDVSGVYREVEQDRKLVFTWAWITTPERESVVTILLRPIDEGVELTLHHEQFADEAARDNHNKGWNALLDHLQGVLD